MIGSSGAEALSRATGDEQLLRTQALANNQQQKRHPDDEKKHRDESEETTKEVSEDSFESTVANAQNQHIQDLEMNASQINNMRRTAPQRMRVSRKTEPRKSQEDKQNQAELNQPIVDERGHVDVSG